MHRVHGGFGGMTHSIRAAGLAALLLGLAPAATAQTVTGTVKDAATQQPIAGAMVSLLTSPEYPATTDADGKFSLDVVSIASHARAKRGPVLEGTRLSFEVAAGGTRVSVRLLDLQGHALRTVVEGSYAPGSYSLDALPADLPAGIYLLRATVGSQARAFRLAAVGRAVIGPSSPKPAARLAKAATGGVDWLVVTKDGYLKNNTEIMQYADAQTVLLQAGKPAASSLGIFTDSAMPMIDWANAAIYSWDQTAILATDSNHVGFGGSVASMQVKTLDGMSWNGWAFHVAAYANGTQPTVDLSPYAGGSLHLAVKGNAKTLGVMISSKNQPSGSAPLVDLGGKGYLPDSAWHEIRIPLSEFGETLKLSDVFVYCGFVAPVNGGDFDPAADYWVDDIWYEPAQ